MVIKKYHQIATVRNLKFPLNIWFETQYSRAAKPSKVYFILKVRKMRFRKIHDLSQVSQAIRNKASIHQHNPSSVLGSYKWHFYTESHIFSFVKKFNCRWRSFHLAEVTYIYLSNINNRSLFFLAFPLLFVNIKLKSNLIK